MEYRSCGACKVLRKRCLPNCILSPYFPRDDPARFECMHRVYGARNVIKKIRDLPVEVRREAVEAMYVEARYRVDDPVYGCVRTISQLQHEISVAKNELATIRGEIATLAALFDRENEAGGSSMEE